MIVANVKAKNMFKTITNIFISHLNIGSNAEIKTNSILLNYERVFLNKLQKSSQFSDSSLKSPSMCHLLSYSDKECLKKIIIKRVVFLPEALVGLNGDTGANIIKSSSLSLSYFNDAKSEFRVKDSKDLFDFWIKQNLDKSQSNFQLVNASNLTIKDETYFLTNGLTTNQYNVSLVFYLKPVKQELGYLFVLKYGNTPKPDNHDMWKTLCPLDQIDDNNERYHKVFIKAKETLNFKGFIGYGLRELNETEINVYCNKSYSSTIAPLLKTKPIFSENFYIRVFLRACYYYDNKLEAWSTYGMEIGNDSNLTHTHCYSSHLTQFAGGFVVLPSEINFEYAFANSSFDQNKTIYLTVIFVSVIYILLALWCFYMDKIDKKKVEFIS